MATSTTALSNSEYRSVKAVSKSDLDLITKSPALLDWSRNSPQQQSDVADIGNAVHCKLLEADKFDDQFRKMPALDRRTKAGKEAAEAFELSMAGKTVFSADDYDMVTAMCDSAMAHPVAKYLLTEPGVSEESIFFEVDGVKCKCRPDRRLFNDKIVVDVKTCDDIEKFSYSISDYRYHVQDVFYSEGVEQLTGEPHRFWFLVIGKRKVFGRHPVRVFELEQEDKDCGMVLASQNIEAYKEYQAFGSGLDVEVIKMARSRR